MKIVEATSISAAREILKRGKTQRLTEEVDLSKIDNLESFFKENESKIISTVERQLRLKCARYNAKNVTRARNTLLVTVEPEKTYGIFDVMIKTATYQFEVYAAADGSIGISVNLKYEHPGGGTNGYRVGTVWIEDDLSFKGKREGY